MPTKVSYLHRFSIERLRPPNPLNMTFQSIAEIQLPTNLNQSKPSTTSPARTSSHLPSLGFLTSPLKRPPQILLASHWIDLSLETSPRKASPHIELQLQMPLATYQSRCFIQYLTKDKPPLSLSAVDEIAAVDAAGHVPVSMLCPVAHIRILTERPHVIAALDWYAAIGGQRPQSCGAFCDPNSLL